MLPKHKLMDVKFSVERVSPPDDDGPLIRIYETTYTHVSYKYDNGDLSSPQNYSEYKEDRMARSTDGVKWYSPDGFFVGDIVNGFLYTAWRSWSLWKDAYEYPEDGVTL